MNMSTNGDEEQILKRQNAFTWPVSLFKAQNYTLKGSSKYNDAALAEKLKALDIFSDDYIENPEDAHIEIKDGEYNVIEEKKGMQAIYDSILAEVKDALDNELPKLSLSDDCYEAPKITKESDTIKNEKKPSTNTLLQPSHTKLKVPMRNLTQPKSLIC